MQHLYSCMLVFAGGGIGSLCRYGLVFLVPWPAGKFPLPTLVANALACLVLGLAIGMHLNVQTDDHRRLLLATGFCGGLSTFSTFIAENWSLYQASQYGLAAAYVASSLALCLVCLILGLKLLS